MNKDLDLFIINEKRSVRDALEKIDCNEKGAVFVVDHNRKMVGTLTDGDIRRALLRGCFLQDFIFSVMNKQFVFARQSDSLEDVYKIAKKEEVGRKIEYIPLLDDEGKVADYFHFSFKGYIPMAKPYFGMNEFKYAAECIMTNWISSQGRFVNEFERNMAKYIGTQYAVAASNGTTALHLALHSLGIGPGDEVIVPTLTFIATANAVTFTGAKPIFVDSEEETWGMDPRKVEEAITKNTRAIIPVHLYGQPCRMDEIIAIAKRHNLYVVEDAAEAHGALYKGKKVGSIGDISCFSFFGNKIITTGEGGMVLTNNKDLYEKIQILRDHGMSKEKRYWHPTIGFNYRLTNIQAAIGCAQLEKIDAILEGKKKIKDWYNLYLSNDSRIIPPPSNTWSKNVFWMYSILLNEDKTKIKRDDLLALLEKYHIGCRPVFYPIHTMPPYYIDKSFPVAEKLSRNGVTLPAHVGLSEENIRMISSIIKKAL